ncbi:hypothetical protein Deipe_0001 [Deinococcus peraridilitoris DSM 19664]|uniref:Uncharacterized protein n=1 Tax=Deinococcus peraridilitoris (strain DSM 19664 / LMG 22246 / CIP 109416 / KR-200) TaxID=937777 RepID=K9ZWS9_DEIPD|nr:hypothetical protein Deipe_0001 [Deinococcus peraridilitoris DSM 19664]
MTLIRSERKLILVMDDLKKALSALREALERLLGAKPQPVPVPVPVRRRR